MKNPYVEGEEEIRRRFLARTAEDIGQPSLLAGGMWRNRPQRRPLFWLDVATVVICAALAVAFTYDLLS